VEDDGAHSILKIEKLGRMTCEFCGEPLDVSEFRVFEELECPECGEIVSVPGRFANYVLLSELGRGGMGAVFLARDVNLNRKVALKVLKPKFGRDPVFVEALLREAKAAAALNHKNIVHIYSFGQEQEQPYIVMEVVDGIRLDECIDPEVEQDEIGWLDIMWQVASGLAAAEQKGVVHGDIKPANILLDRDGNSKISDFGIARFAGSRDDRILGTPLYIAPEKSKGEKADARSDQFSMGASFWHILSGVPPFKGKTSRDVVLSRFEHPAPDVRQYAVHLSEATGRILQKMMATEPEDRYPDFQTLAEELRVLPEKLEEIQLKKQRERERLEEEAAMLKTRLQRRRRRMVGCALLVILIGYVYVALYA